MNNVVDGVKRLKATDGHQHEWVKLDKSNLQDNRYRCKTCGMKVKLRFKGSPTGSTE